MRVPEPLPFVSGAQKVAFSITTFMATVMAADNSAAIATKIIVSRQVILATYAAPWRHAMLRQLPRGRKWPTEGTSAPLGTETSSPE
jgi:hypothetical protein